MINCSFSYIDGSRTDHLRKVNLPHLFNNKSIVIVTILYSLSPDVVTLFCDFVKKNKVNNSRFEISVIVAQFQLKKHRSDIGCLFQCNVGAQGR